MIRSLLWDGINQFFCGLFLIVFPGERTCNHFHPAIDSIRFTHGSFRNVPEESASFFMTLHTGTVAGTRRGDKNGSVGEVEHVWTVSRIASDCSDGKWGRVGDGQLLLDREMMEVDDGQRCSGCGRKQKEESESKGEKEKMVRMTRGGYGTQDWDGCGGGQWQSIVMPIEAF